MGSARVSDRRPCGWSRVDNHLVDTFGAELGVYGVAVYVVLARRASQKDSAVVSIGNIARVLGCSRSSVKTAVRRLVDAGLVEVEYRSDERGQHASEYVLLDVDAAAAVVRAPQQGARIEGPQQGPAIAGIVPVATPGQNTTGVATQPPPGQNTTPPRSKYDHLKKDTYEKDTSEEEAMSRFRLLNNALSVIRDHSAPVAALVEMKIVSPEMVEALRSSPGHRRELAKIEAERSRRPDR